MVELLLNVPGLKIFLNLTFKFSDSRVNNLSIKLPPYKIFVSLVFKFTAVKETLNWGVTNRFVEGM